MDSVVYNLQVKFGQTNNFVRITSQCTLHDLWKGLYTTHRICAVTSKIFIILALASTIPNHNIVRYYIVFWLVVVSLNSFFWDI
jgi:hypothetical protein